MRDEVRETSNGWSGGMSERARGHSKDCLWHLRGTGSQGKPLNLQVLSWVNGINGGKDCSGETDQEAIARIQVMGT